MMKLLILAKGLWILSFSMVILTICVYLINIKNKSLAITKLYSYLKKITWITSILTFTSFMIGAYNIIGIKGVILLSILPIICISLIYSKRKKIKKPS